MTEELLINWREFFGRTEIESTMRTEPNGDIVIGGIHTAYDYYGRMESFTWYDNVRVTT